MPHARLSTRLARASWTALLASTALLAATGTRAQSGDLEELLEESVVSTPSRIAQSASNAPATTTIITAEQLRVHGITSLDEAINFVSLGMVTTRPLHAVEIGARGVLLTADYGNHVLLLVDGHALNEAWDGTAYFERGAAIPFELIDHIEITLGPGSVMYGSQAMLGVINVVTKRARDFGGARIVLEGDFTAPLDETGRIELGRSLRDYGFGYRAAAGYGVELELFGEHGEATLELDYYRQDGPNWQFARQMVGPDAVTAEPVDFGPRAPRGVWGGRADASHYTVVPSAYGRLIIGDLTLLVRGGMHERGAPYLDGIVQTAGDFDDPYNHERDRFINAEAKLRTPLSSRLTLTSRLYADLNEYVFYNRAHAVEACPAGLLDGCERELLGVGRILGAELQGALALPEAHAQTLIGIDGRMLDASSDLEVRDLATGAVAPFHNDYEQTDALIAPYVQQSLRPWSWLDVNAGLRFDAYTNVGAKLSPRVALGFDVWRGGTLKLVYAEAFRAPASYETQYADVSGSVAARDLGPEKVRSFEASFEQRVSTHRVMFGVFRSFWLDMVSYAYLSEEEISAAIEREELVDGTTEAYQVRNLGTIDNYGYNAGYEGALFDHRLRLGASITSAYTRARADDESPATPLTVGPSLFGNARASYAFGRGLTLALAARYLARRPADRAFDGGFSAPPYAPPDVELKLAASGDIPGIDRLQYRASFTFTTATREAYVIGPVQYAYDETTQAELAPLRRLFGFVGVQYVIE